VPKESFNPQCNRLVINAQDLEDIVQEEKCDKCAASEANLVLELLIINQIREAHERIKDAQHEVLIEDLDA
jgi:hypothetical protein